MSFGFRAEAVEGRDREAHALSCRAFRWRFLATLINYSPSMRFSNVIHEETRRSLSLAAKYAVRKTLACASVKEPAETKMISKPPL